MNATLLALHLTTATTYDSPESVNPRLARLPFAAQVRAADRIIAQRREAEVDARWKAGMNLLDEIHAELSAKNPAPVVAEESSVDEKPVKVDGKWRRKAQFKHAEQVLEFEDTDGTVREIAANPVFIAARKAFRAFGESAKSVKSVRVQARVEGRAKRAESAYVAKRAVQGANVAWEDAQ